MNYSYNFSASEIRIGDELIVVKSTINQFILLSNIERWLKRPTTTTSVWPTRVIACIKCVTSKELEAADPEFVWEDTISLEQNVWQLTRIPPYSTRNFAGIGRRNEIWSIISWSVQWQLDGFPDPAWGRTQLHETLGAELNSISKIIFLRDVNHEIQISLAKFWRHNSFENVILMYIFETPSRERLTLKYLIWKSMALKSWMNWDGRHYLELRVYYTVTYSPWQLKIAQSETEGLLRFIFI